MFPMDAGQVNNRRKNFFLFFGVREIAILTECCGFFQAGSIAHELGHTFGFVHEQSRSDRDQHIQIVGGNIIPGKENNFQKYSNKKVYTYNLTYDIGSLMHYSDKVTGYFSRSSFYDKQFPVKYVTQS